jgi:hypothetical protein
MKNMKNTDIIKSLAAQNVSTENGDTALATTGNANLDLFALEGGLRNNKDDLLILFSKAYKEDKATALKNLFYLRDIRHGLGERDAFRFLLKKISSQDPETIKKIIGFVSALGRYDDLFSCLETPLEEKVVEMVRAQLKDDMDKKGKNLSYSLLSKWMPSINTSSSQTRRLGLNLAEKLKLSKKDYRKMLSYLRKGLIIETDLTNKDYTFDYSSVPSQAMHKYTSAFLRNDKERYSFYLNQVQEGKAKINVSTLYPYQIFREYDDLFMPEESKKAMEVKWKALKREEIGEGTIVVRDGSGSMCGLPDQIATSLSIFFGECLKGDFHNSFITFSSKPELVTFEDGSLFDKIEYVKTFDDCSNTNIRKVFNLILKAETSKDFDSSHPIKRILIISDMEFDMGTDNVPTYDSFVESFKKAGLEIPQVIYWNVEARSVHFATDKKSNVLLVSGASNHVMEAIVKGENLDPVAFMNLTLAPYSFIDEALKEN